jgi:XrtN system VIT domain protein
METLTYPPLTHKISTQNHPASRSRERLTLLGYVLLLVSAALYGLEEYLDVSRGDDNFAIFFIHYFIALAFTIVLIVNKAYGVRRSWQKEHIHKTVILLNLFLVSAYALNRELPVFEDSVPWLCAYLLLTSATLLSYSYFNRLPKAINRLQEILLGSALILYLYMTFFVANFYMVGTVGIILFGIGAHIFVPLLLLFTAIRLLIINHEKRRINFGWVASGALITISVVASFTIEWNSRVKAIDRLANQSVIHADTDLPIWVKVAQTVKNDWITERILKSRLVYTVSNKELQWNFFPLGNNWDEKRKHDPLVFIASVNSNTSLTEEDRKNILKAITDSRHKSHERLWSGDNLSTSYIVSDVDIYPELRIAYTEHYLNIRNNDVNRNRWWGNSQEAIYTFQLPEGSVVTSLSLWVNGKEEKAILTSKQKATQAYTTIVRREMRDPSVVHWQEGNTISVRVFPCTPQEERKFKIGITSPLAVTGDKLLYKNVNFRGPNARSATQTSRVRIVGNSQGVDFPDHFTKNMKGEYLSERNYDPDLTIAMDITPIKGNQFSFDGFTYSLANADPSTSKVDFRDVYLDINNSWSSAELESLYPLLKDYNVYAYIENDFLRVSEDNWKDITSALGQANFSLFPFHHIKETEKSVVVTKGKELSPYLQDVKTSAFADGIKQYFASGKKVYLFNLEGGTSTYIKSLKELRAFNFTRGNVTKLFDILRSKTFPLVAESEDRIVLHESDMVIEKKLKAEAEASNNAPDHLLRLFAYNNIMRQVGTNFFNDDFINEQLVDEAATAYVVSPVSSLIVLETKEDYERFGIKDKDNSLHNATKNSSGAVPEPHEWALIIVFLIFVVFYIVRHSQFKLSFRQK